MPSSSFFTPSAFSLIFLANSRMSFLTKSFISATHFVSSGPLQSLTSSQSGNVLRSEPRTLSATPIALLLSLDQSIHDFADFNADIPFGLGSGVIGDIKKVDRVVRVSLRALDVVRAFDLL